MIGAIIGDIVGSRYEFNNHRSKEFELFSGRCFFTDDTVMTLAVAKALKKSGGNAEALPELTVEAMQKIGRNYPDCGYGGKFGRWVFSSDPKPYNSFGNGAAMRISPVGMFSSDIGEAKRLSYAVTSVTHNHPEGIKGAESVAVAMALARQGKTKEEIKNYIAENYYKIDFTLDGIRSSYRFNETCQDTVPQAFEAFFESENFEDAIRNAISVGGDSDTLAAITGSVAEAYYGVPRDMEKAALAYLDGALCAVYEECRIYNKVV